MIAARVLRTLPLVAALFSGSFAHAQQLPDDAAERTLRHESDLWLLVSPHLPDLATGTPASLEIAGDVLRARRLPEDALDYYRAAIRRGGDEASLVNRLGVTLLELRQTNLARACFRRAVLLRPKDAQSWNNLGASEYVLRDYVSAIQDYKQAVKLNKKAAIFRSNLGTAYFDLKDYESAGKQFEVAVSLDHNVFQRGGFGGVEAHVLSPADRGKFCFEMARLSARHHDDENVLHWLAQASEAGLSLRYEMSLDKDFGSYRKDPRIDLLIHNARALRAGQIATAEPTPPLPAEKSRLD